VDATTHYVDGSYVGPSDGSANQPHKSIVAAINAVPNGGIVAVAAGTYSEYVLIYDKKVKLRGRCPSMVKVVTPGTFQPAAVIVHNGADSEVSGLEVTGSDIAVGIDTSTGVLLQNLWLHDNTAQGLLIQSVSGTSSATMKGCLLENNFGNSITVNASTLVVEASLIRDTKADQVGLGVGLNAFSQDSAVSDVTISGSVFERNVEADVIIYESKLLLEGSLIRDSVDGSQPIATGAVTVVSQMGPKAEATIRKSVIRNAVATSIALANATATVENTTLLDSQADSKGGSAIGFGMDGSTGVIKNSAISGMAGAGVLAIGSQVTVESTVVSDTTVDAAGHAAGFAFECSSDEKVPSDATVKGSLVTGSDDAGIYILGSKADIQSTVVEDTRSVAGNWGYGVFATASGKGAQRSHLTLQRSIVEKSEAAGVYVQGSTASLLGVVVRNNDLAAAAGQGVGVLFGPPKVAQLTIGTMEGCLVEGSREAGVLVQSAEAHIQSTAINSTEGNAAGELGIGVDAQTIVAGAPAEVSVNSSIISSAHRAAILAAGAQLTVDSCSIVDTGADATGLGVGIASSFQEIAPSLLVRGTKIEGSVGAGMLLYDASSTLEGNVVTTTTVASPNLFGDALTVVSSETTSLAIVRGNVLSQTERAGIIASDATVRYEALELACQLHDLVGLGTFSFEDTGGARCGCPKALDACSSVNDVLLDIPEKVAGVVMEY